VRPSDLLSHQAEFTRRYTAESNPDTRMAQTLFAASWLAHQGRSNRDLTELMRNIDTRPNLVPQVVRDTPEVIGHFAQMAMPIKVEPTMVDLVSWVADDFADTEAIDMGLAPAPFGLVFLEKPIVCAGPDDLPVHIDWLLWGQSYGQTYRGMAVCGFNDGGRPDPLTARWLAETRQAGYGAHPYHYVFMGALGDTLPLGPADDGPTFARPVIYNDVNEDGDVVMSFATWTGWNVNRWVYALWVVMNQEIADVREEHADRATKRRMARMRLPPAVSVIRLRRPANPHRQHEEGHVEWQHHWIVRGHPRWQACGPGRRERKLIWVPMHTKGDLSKPLHQSKKVYDVAR